MTASKIIVQEVGIDEVFVIGERRPVNEDAVTRIADSIANIGLQTPISVRGDGTLVDPETGEDCGGYELIAGRHRLEACKRLGWDRIPVIEWPADSDRITIELWEIAENLHRADLSKDERDRQIVRYAALLKKKEAQKKLEAENQAGQTVQPEIGYKKPPPQEKGIASKVAEQTGLNQRTVRRALNKKTVVVDHEAEAARKEAEKQKRAQDAAVRAAETERFAEWLMTRTDLDELPVVISWLEGTKAKDVIAALRRAAA